MSVRKQVAEFTRCCDILLNSIDAPLTDYERELLLAYVNRMQTKFDLKTPVAAD